MGMRALFGPLLRQVSIFLNETNVIWIVPVNYILSVMYSSIPVKLLHLWPKTSKNWQNWPYLNFRNFVSVRFTNLGNKVIT